MIHARKDYTERIQDAANLIPADEPVFLIRAQDHISPDAVRAWALLHQRNGGSDVAYQLAIRHADLMEQWGKTHRTKSADVPPEAA